jgi:hypothetical protein
MRLKFFFALAICLMVTAPAAVRAQVTGSTTLTVTKSTPAQPPSGTTSLLAGMTPSHMTVPSGWSVLVTQDFESGGVGAGQELAFSSVSTSKAHGGSHSMVLTFPANNGGNESPGGEWILHSANLGPSGDVYMSWYSYLDPNAYSQTESFFAVMSNPQQALIMDTQQGSGGSANLWFSPQTNASPQAPDCANGPENSGLPQNCGFYGQRWSLNLGTWEQEELQIHPSTCSGGTPNNDGFVTMWINGVQVYHIDKNNSADRSNPMGGNINGCVNMSISDLQVGGIWTYFTPNPSTFNKYVDDIIILKR